MLDVYLLGRGTITLVHISPKAYISKVCLEREQSHSNHVTCSCDNLRLIVKNLSRAMLVAALNARVYIFRDMRI